MPGLSEEVQRVSATAASAGGSKPLILFIITRGEHGGAQSHVWRMVQCLAGTFRVELAVGEEGFLPDACRDIGVPVHVIPQMRREIHPLRDVAALFQTIALLRRLRPDLVHAHTTKAGITGRLAAKLCAIPSVYTAHSWNFSKRARLVWRLLSPRIERLAAGWTSRIITVSHDARNTALNLQIAKPSTIITIHNGVEDVPMRAVSRPDSVPVIAMVARFSDGKDHETLIRAFAELTEPARLMLIGDGPLRKSMELLADQLEVADRVDFLGDRGDVPECLTRVSIFVLASEFENLPISILEAMRAGLPVVATEVGGMPEAVINGQNGYTIPVGSVSALKEALRALLTNVELRQRMGEASRALFLEKFLERDMVESTIAVYSEVLGQTATCGGQQTADARNHLASR